MLKIPSVIEARFDVALAEKAVPQQLNFHYKKWLRYYLDFCHNYHLDKSAKQSLSKGMGAKGMGARPTQLTATQ